MSPQTLFEASLDWGRGNGVMESWRTGFWGRRETEAATPQHSATPILQSSGTPIGWAAKDAENHGDTQSGAYDFAAGMCPRITQIDEEKLGREKAQDAQDEGGLSVTGRFSSPLCASATLPLPIAHEIHETGLFTDHF